MPFVLYDYFTLWVFCVRSFDTPGTLRCSQRASCRTKSKTVFRGLPRFACSQHTLSQRFQSWLLWFLSLLLHFPPPSPLRSKWEPCNKGHTHTHTPEGVHFTNQMYAQRRQLAAPAIATDQDARNANFHLMHSRRRQILEAQLEEKMEMLKQFTNSRGIGMRGQTVPQHDIDLLQQQIANIRQQLDGGGAVPAPADAGSRPVAQQQLLPPTPSNQASAITPGTAVAPAIPSQQSFPAKSAPGGNWGGVQQQPLSQQQLQQQTQGMRSAGGYPFPQAPSSTCSTGSRRDQVWQQKYDAWLRRGGRAAPAAGGIVSPRAQGGISTSSVVSSVAPSSHYSAGAPSQQQQPYGNSVVTGGGGSSRSAYAPPPPQPMQPAMGLGVPIPTSTSSIVSSLSTSGGAGAIMYGRRATPPASPSTQNTDPFAQRQPAAPVQWTQQQQQASKQQSLPPQYHQQQPQQQQQQQQPPVHGRRGQQNVSQRPW